MKPLNPQQKKWLVAIHILFAGIWVGAGVCLMLLNGHHLCTEALEHVEKIKDLEEDR
jgi:hypothetical protein